VFGIYDASLNKFVSIFANIAEVVALIIELVARLVIVAMKLVF
jgi:hypothetical protein